MKSALPKISLPIIAAMRKLAPITTRPIMALVICFWAVSTLDESPPAEMMPKPPRMN